MEGERLPHLVQEEGAAVGRLEEALLVLVGVGEGALHVAEQLALQQRVGKGPAVDGDEGRRRGAGERAWMARATSSLPVPLSPVMSTVEPVGAIERTISKSAAMAGRRR